jgi:hypothetical protein
MRGRVPAAVESLATRGAPARNIVSRNHTLSRAIFVRFGMREKPGEAAAVSLRGRCD